MSYENNGFFTRLFGIAADRRSPGGNAIGHPHYSEGRIYIQAQEKRVPPQERLYVGTLQKERLRLS